jgi:translation initiation factor IF-1
VPSSELEFIGLVTKMLGNGMFYVNNIDHTQYLGHIRNKFKGKSKHQNTISIGSIVLIGCRHWEAPLFKNVDLISVYDSNDIDSLAKSFHIPTLQSNFTLTHDILFDHDTHTHDIIAFDDNTSIITNDISINNHIIHFHDL